MLRAWVRHAAVLRVRALATVAQTEGERRLARILESRLMPEKLVVQDVSGGCGAMYKIDIHSSKFQGKRTLQQHQMVLEALKGEVESMHGLTISTHVPKTEAGH